MWFICLLVHLQFIVHRGSATIKEEIGELFVCCNTRFISYPHVWDSIVCSFVLIYIENFFFSFNKSLICHLFYISWTCMNTYLYILTFFKRAIYTSLYRHLEIWGAWWYILPLSFMFRFAQIYCNKLCSQIRQCLYWR